MDQIIPTVAVCDLGVFIDVDLSMRTNVTKTVSAFFVMLRYLRSICQLCHVSVLQLLSVSLVLSYLEYGNATLAAIPQYQLKQLQSVMNSAAWLVFSSSKFNHIASLLHQLHWLKAPERIQYKLAVLAYKCCNGIALT